MTAKLPRMLLRVDRPADGVAVLTLDRPEKRNALSLDLRVELAEALDALAADEDVRCVVVTGAGTAFCAGMDVTQFGGDRAHKERIVQTSTRLFDRLARAPLPIVAAVNGPALAGGFALALLCDVRVASTTATFGFPEIGRYIPPSYAAAAAALPEALARRLSLTGEILDAERALALGVVSEVYEPDALGPAAVALAARIAAAPGHVTREVKRRVLLGGEQTWLALLADEGRVLREALLG
ncbi:MAG: enoyl-CoA hydratase/isomerase family protein [Actinobacteria bacterium]|nr:MAG: enoyl-CoA hydratase/isomerase family protein [Actinomycetota bacterium]